MSTTTERRSAIVTGGSGGIGRAVVERLAADGYAIAVHYAGNRQKAEDAATSVREAGGSAITVAADIADETAMGDVFRATVEAFGGVDVVVNTAGAMTLAPTSSFGLEDFDRLVRTNLRGAYVVSQLAARHVRSGGAIINFSSTVTRTLPPTYGAYVMTKAGIEGLGPILARELRGRDITVNTVAPGPTATPLFLDGKDDATVQRFADATPLRRIGMPEDIAETVAFLAGPARWVNGQTIFVNGGLG